MIHLGRVSRLQYTWHHRDLHSKKRANYVYESCRVASQ